MGKSLNGKELGVGITQRKDGLYQASFVDRFGKRCTLYSRNLRDIRMQLSAAKVDDARCRSVLSPKISLDDWYNIWIVELKRHVRSTSIRTYSRQYNLVKDELGYRKLIDIRLIHVQAALNKLKTDASRRAARSVLMDIFNRAVESDLILKNPVIGANCNVTCECRKEIHILSDEEIRKLKGLMTNSHTFLPIFKMALGTGMRIGEILGLCIEDVDFENHILYVRHSLAYLPGNGSPTYKLHAPKTKAGNRVIPMTQEVERTLKEAIVKKNANTYKPSKGLEGLIFVSRTNRPQHESNIRKELRYYAKQLDISGVTVHALRHTFATKCIAKGMKPKVLQAILGHASLQMTMDLYCHVEQESIKTEMARIYEMA